MKFKFHQKKWKIRPNHKTSKPKLKLLSQHKKRHLNRILRAHPKYLLFSLIRQHSSSCLPPQKKGRLTHLIYWTIQNNLPIKEPALNDTGRIQMSVILRKLRIKLAMWPKDIKLSLNQLSRPRLRCHWRVQANTCKAVIQKARWISRCHEKLSLKYQKTKRQPMSRRQWLLAVT